MRLDVEAGAEEHVETDANRPRSRRAASTARSRIRRHPERSRPELAEDVLRHGRVAHVAFVVDGQPFVLPFAYHFEDGVIYLHGAQTRRAMGVLSSGSAVCVEVTLLDGLVASRDAKSHSMNYRSVVVFGRAQFVADDQEKRALFERMTARYFPERTPGHDYLPARAGDLRAVALLRVVVDELSAKSRSGPPAGKHDGAEHTGTGSCFVVSIAGADV